MGDIFDWYEVVFWAVVQEKIVSFKENSKFMLIGEKLARKLQKFNAKRQIK